MTVLILSTHGWANVLILGLMYWFFKVDNFGFKKLRIYSKQVIGNWTKIQLQGRLVSFHTSNLRAEGFRM